MQTQRNCKHTFATCVHRHALMSFPSSVRALRAASRAPRVSLDNIVTAFAKIDDLNLGHRDALRAVSARISPTDGFTRVARTRAVYHGHQWHWTANGTTTHVLWCDDMVRYVTCLSVCLCGRHRRTNIRDSDAHRGIVTAAQPPAVCTYLIL